VRQYEKGTKDIKEDKGEGASSLGALQEVRSFDFLTSNFGSQLPTRHSIKVVFADPIDACSPLVVDASPAPESTTTAGSGDLESTAAEMNVDGVVASTNSADPSNSNTAINATDAAALIAQVIRQPDLHHHLRRSSGRVRRRKTWWWWRTADSVPST